MIIYFIPIFLCALTAVSRQLSENRKWTVIFGCLLCLFLCFGYMTGSDWRNYELYYDTLDFNHFYYGYNSEPGYYLLMMLMKWIGVPFWVFHISTKVFLFAIVYRIIFKYSSQTGWISLMYYIPWFGLYFFVDNPMRNCIAVGLFLLATDYIIEGKFWKFFWMSLLAAFFHLTALVVFPCYMFLTKDLKKWKLAVLYVVINIIFFDRDLIIKIIAAVLSPIPYFNNKLITYFLFHSDLVQGKFISLGMVWQTVVFVLLLCYKERITDGIGGKMGLLAFNSSMVFFMLLPFAMSIQVAMRFQMYFSVFLCICIGYLVLAFEWRSRWACICVIFLISFYTCFDRVTSSARYVPYSNVIEYAVKGEFPSYSKRYFYNMKHSPYTDEVDYMN